MRIWYLYAMAYFFCQENYIKEPSHDINCCFQLLAPSEVQVLASGQFSQNSYGTTFAVSYTLHFKQENKV